MSKEIEEAVSMKTGQNPLIKQVITWMIGCLLVTGFAAAVYADQGTPVTVNNNTDWSTSPSETVAADIPYLNYNGGGIEAGINTFQVSGAGPTFTANGFCIDPFHWDLPGPVSPYYIVPLVDAPKAPAQLNTYTATEIEDLWAEFYSPTMSSSSAAGLQIAIWELVSSNAIAVDGLPANEGFTLTSGNDYGAGADLASLATYTGPAANLIALTGPGQDFVIAAPDNGKTCILLALAMGALVIARQSIVNAAVPARKPVAVRVTRR